MAPTTGKPKAESSQPSKEAGSSSSTPASKKAGTPKSGVAKKTQPRAKRALPGTKGKKRPAADKSTTTKTTAAAAHVNVYDAVLGESEDLLQAAMEAQALGRLKMASAYQLLLHARLVGLGKRFDRAQVQGSVPSATASSPASTNADSSPSTAATATPDPKDVHSELSKILPTSVELDGAMMEHLARAAMELHHQRTGRRIQSDSVAASPAAAATVATNASIAWTEEEKQKVQTALDAGTIDPSQIAAELQTRTEAQVRAYLRNTKELEKGSLQMEQEFKDEIVSPRRRGGRGRKPPTQAMNTVPNAKLDAKALLAGKGL